MYRYAPTTPSSYSFNAEPGNHLRIVLHLKLLQAEAKRRLLSFPDANSVFFYFRWVISVTRYRYDASKDDADFQQNPLLGSAI